MTSRSDNDRSRPEGTTAGVDAHDNGRFTGTRCPNPVRIALLAGALMVVGCTSGGNGRPSDTAWQAVWDTQHSAIPDAETFQTGGRELCDGLLGTLQVNSPELLPTPTEALDGVVEAWIDHVEAVAFDCPQDTTILMQRLETLEVLAAEINAGLSADRDQ